MGRELQKKKNKSSIAKVTKKPKSKKKILNNPIIAANWDQKQTLSQNYQRLGLATKLNTPTGGVERLSSHLKKEAEDAERLAADSKARTERTNHDRLAIKAAKLPTDLVPTEAKIERDPKTGKILRVIDDGAGTEDGSKSTAAERAKAFRPLEDPLNALDDMDKQDDSVESDDNFEGFDDQHAPDGHVGPRAIDLDTSVLRQLEARVAQLQKIPKKKRKQSEREQEWVRSMVEKHGRNYDAMFRDSKLNIMQQSKGDLMRRVQKFLDG